MSAFGLQRMLSLSNYHTAWLMLQKLRQAMIRVERDHLHGLVDVDETILVVKKREYVNDSWLVKHLWLLQLR